MINSQCIYSWTPDNMNSLFFKNTNETNVSFQYLNNYKLLEVASIKQGKKDNGIKSLLLYPNEKLGFYPTYPLNLKQNNRYSLQISGYSQNTNSGSVYLWIRSKENNTCMDLSCGYTQINKCSTPVVTKFDFTTRLNDRVWFGIYFKHSNCGDKYYISQIQLFDLNLCGSPNVLVCNVCGLTNCNCYARPYSYPICNRCGLVNCICYLYQNSSQVSNMCQLNNCYATNNNCYPTNIVYGPKYYPTTNQFGPYRQQYNCNGTLLTNDCNVNTIETNNSCSTTTQNSSCNECLTNTTLCNYCGLNILNCSCNIKCNSCGMLLTQCICHNNTATTTKTYPPGVTKECIYGFDILNTSEQLDNLSKYQQLTYVKFYTNYTINITTTPKSITGYIFLLGNVYLKWDYKNSISKGGFEFGYSSNIIKTDQIYDLNTEYIIEIINQNKNNSKTIKMTINTVEKVNETKNIDMENEGYISFFSSCHNQLKDKYIGLIKQFYLYHNI